VGAVGMLIAGAHSDRTGERRKHLACAAGVGALGFLLSGWVHSPVLTLVGFSLAALGVLSMLGPFWAMSTCTMSGAAAAGAIAYINSVGNLGGFAGPYLMGAFKGSTGSFAAGLYTLAGGLLLGGLLALTVRHDPALDRSMAAATERGAIAFAPETTG
jgi:MFS transporter, ACS family, tartrate transporter